MNINQAKKKLKEISESTGIKHPKVLISELCTIVKFLLEEIDKIKDPPIVELKRFPDDNGIRKPPPIEPIKPYKHEGEPPHQQWRPERKGNAGDAE